MSLRPLLLMVTAACATAGNSQHQGTSDAPPGTSDGPHNNSDGPAPHNDAAPIIDSPPGSCATPFMGALATWSFTGEPGSQASTAATSMATGVNAGAVSRAAALTVASGVGSINSSNWPSAAQRDLTKYYTFSVTPPSGCQMDLTGVSIDALSSGTGPSMALIATSSDAYAQTATVSTTAASTPALTVSGATGAIEVRVYGFSASSTGGTMRLRNTLTLQGKLR
ncbi:MAG: hypothetical protein JO257_30705 [Deltaproteobacteria bacterium]|nr:hypothetical protein [Deltaproteobacteria bacterium]